MAKLYGYVTSVDRDGGLATVQLDSGETAQVETLEVEVGDRLELDTDDASCECGACETGALN